MTNAVATVTSADPWWIKYASEIITSVITASVMGIGGLFWTYLGHPRMKRWQKRREADSRRKEIERSLVNLTMSAGTSLDMDTFVSVRLRNDTNRPVVVRRVWLLPESGGKLGLWHNTNARYSRELTKETETGIQLTPHESATWYFHGDITGPEPMVVKKCQIDFEYDAGDGEVGLCEMVTPPERADYLNSTFRLWWDMVQRKHAGKDAEQKNPTTESTPTK